MRVPAHRVVLTASIGLAAVGAAAAPAAAGFYDDAQFFEPDHWSVGDPGTTHQVWDNFANLNATGPDNWTTNPGLTTGPTLTVASPGFLPGPGRAYAFAGNYSLTADIPNVGAGGLAGAGTHIIIQVASTVNPDLGSVLLDSLQILDADGNAITGGGNAQALRVENFGTRSVASTFGPVDFQETIAEFFLPEFTDGFRVVWTQAVHTGFDTLRIDSIVAQEAFPNTVVPEPASLVLLSMGAACLLRRRRIA
jgi:hypothetical protein